MNGQGQYFYRVYEDGKQIDGRDVDDPFVTTTIEFRLSRLDAFKAIFKPLVKRFVTHVGGKDAAYRVVAQGDYTPPPPVEKSDAVGYYQARR